MSVKIVSEDGQKLTIQITVDISGSMLLTCDDGWRESMVGTISLFDEKGERQHTIYVGEALEYGQSNFMNRFEKEIEKVKILHANALCIGIADGAKNNWPFLEKHTEKQLLDFYHVTEHLTECSYAAFSQRTGKQERIKWLNDRCHRLKHEKNAPQDILNVLRLRELTQTDGRLQQLWMKVNQYGVPCIH